MNNVCTNFNTHRNTTTIQNVAILSEDHPYGDDGSAGHMAVSNNDNQQPSHCCDTSSACSPSARCSNLQHQTIAIGQIQQHLIQSHSPSTSSNQSLCFQSPSVTTTEIGTISRYF